MGHDPVLGFSMMGMAPFLALALALGWPSGPKSTRMRRYPSGGLRFLSKGQSGRSEGCSSWGMETYQLPWNVT